VHIPVLILLWLTAASPAPEPASPSPGPASPTPAAVTCAHPNVPGKVTFAFMPQMPAMAANQGIEGVVYVAVALDEKSHITGMKVVSSPSGILNNAALEAARNSTFQTAIKNCKPVAGDFTFGVVFSL
jgi:TonB family protein